MPLTLGDQAFCRFPVVSLPLEFGNQQLPLAFGFVTLALFRGYRLLLCGGFRFGSVFRVALGTVRWGTAMIKARIPTPVLRAFALSNPEFWLDSAEFRNQIRVMTWSRRAAAYHLGLVVNGCVT